MSAIEVYVGPSSDPRFDVTVQLVGELDAHAAPGFRQHVGAALSARSGPIAVDCARLTFIDASGLGALVYLANEARRQERAVFLCNLLPPVSNVLHVSRVDRLFERGEPAEPSSA